MTWIVYAGLVAALILRFEDPQATRRPAPVPTADEPLRLVALHHALFFTLLVGAPVEAILVGGVASHRVVGAIAFASGVALYRAGVVALGDAVSPFVAPNPAGHLVTAGPYRWVRHPIYVGQLLIALGAPLTLGCRWTLVVSAAAAVVLGVRIAIEEAVLARTYPEYAHYAARAKRVVPFVF